MKSRATRIAATENRKINQSVLGRFLVIYLAIKQSRR